MHQTSMSYDARIRVGGIDRCRFRTATITSQSLFIELGARHFFVTVHGLWQ